MCTCECDALCWKSVCLCVWCLTVKPLCCPPPSFTFWWVRWPSERERERERGRVKSTQGLSKWFKRDVTGLQHMVGSDFLMQIGKDQIKAAWQPINQPSNQTWQLSIMAPSSPRNPIVCSQIVYLIPRKEKKSSKGRDFFSLPLEQRSYALGSNTYKALVSPLWHASGTHTKNTLVCFTVTDGIWMADKICKLSWTHVGNNRKRKFTVVNSSDTTTEWLYGVESKAANATLRLLYTNCSSV